MELGFMWIFSILNRFYQYQVGYLLEQIMNLFFQIEDLQLLIFFMGDQGPVWVVLFYVFFCNIIKVNHFLGSFITLLPLGSSFYILLITTIRFFFLHITVLFKSLLIPYAYVSIESTDFILSWLLIFNAVLLTCSVSTLSFLLLNIFCDSSINYCFL